MYKAVLHDHLDGGLRASTAKELAIKDNYLPLIMLMTLKVFSIENHQNPLKIILKLLFTLQL